MWFCSIPAGKYVDCTLFRRQLVPFKSFSTHCVVIFSKQFIPIVYKSKAYIHHMSNKVVVVVVVVVAVLCICIYQSSAFMAVYSSLS